MKKFVREMRRYFNAQAKLRERLLNLSGKAVRNSSRAIAATHRQDKKSALRFLGRAEKELNALLKIARKNPQFLTYGAVLSAQQEYAEARLFKNLVERGELLSPKRLGVPYQPYLGAVADVVGELRRRVLDAIRINDVKGAEKTLGLMEEIFELLMEFDYREAVLPGMKRRQDVARQIVEKTRGDLTLALRQERLEKAMRRKK
jgi:translin